MKFYFLFFLLSSFSQAAIPKPDWASGRLGAQQFSSRSESLQTSTYAWLKLDPSLLRDSDQLILRASLLGKAFYNSIDRKKNFNFDGDWREGYLQLNPATGLEVRLGKIITSWGKTDAVNPTDYLTARDLTFMSEDTELKRLGGVGTEVRFTPSSGVSPFQFTAVFLGYGPRNKQLIPSSFSVSGIGFQREQTDSKISSENLEWALKAAYTKENWDISFSIFKGRDRYTDFVFVPVPTAAVQNIVQKNPEFLAWGMDASLGLQKWIMRFESAYYQSDYGGKGFENSALTHPDHWDSVLGFERPIGDDFRFIAQALLRVHPDWVSPGSTYQNVNPVFQSIARAVAQQNAILKNYQRKERLGATLSLAYESLEHNWSGDLSVMGNFMGGDKVWRPKVAYKPIEGFKVHLGAEVYSGDRDETFGILKDFSNVFLEGQYYF